MKETEMKWEKTEFMKSVGYSDLEERPPSKMIKLPLRRQFRDFPGGAVVKTPHSQCRGPKFDPWSGN